MRFTELAIVDHAPAGFQFAGQTFTLVAYQADAPLPGFHFQQPLLLTSWRYAFGLRRRDGWEALFLAGGLSVACCANGRVLGGSKSVRIR